MHLLGPLLLLLEYLAFSDSNSWKVEHPNTLYTWKGACLWIPCSFTIPRIKKSLDNLTLYHNYEYDNITKNFRGTILYDHPKAGGGRVQYVGDSKRNTGTTYKQNCSLSINPVKEGSGWLGLRMTSGTDKWMEKMNLNVSEMPLSPHIQLPPEIQESEKVTLTCSLNFACPGYPIQLKWSLEEPNITQTTQTTLTTMAISTQSQLMFQAQWTHHRMNLTCQLWNNTDGWILSEEMVQLDVKHRPQIKISPREATVKEGENVTLMCHIISSHPESRGVSWHKDGSPLWQKEYNLTLSIVTRKESGKYHCEAHNALGPGKSEEVVLQVQYAPEPSKVQILTLPAKEGNSVEMTCISLAFPPPTNYTWYHNEEEVLGMTGKNFQIPEVLLEHAGHYACLAQNSLGSGQVGQEAELDVQYSPKGVTTVIQNPTPIQEGQAVTLSCKYNSSNPAVNRYEWSPRVSRDEPPSGVLMIPKVAWNAQPIACAACNRWCTWAASVNLDVQYAPRDVRVLQISPHLEIHSGHRVLLRCDFSSSRPKEVRFFWKKNGSLLEEGRELSFASISPEDAGDYSCSVSNSIGQTTSEARRLHVLYAPRELRVSIAPRAGVVEGEKAALVCQSDANPPVFRYTWFDWNNQDLHHSAQTLRLEPVQIQHSGAYRCQATNQLGTGDSAPSTLTVYYSPETIGRRAAVGIGICLAILILAIWGAKLRRSWKRIRDQQGLQENSSGQSFFVRNKKIRRTPLTDGPHALGCHNPVMEDGVSYAVLNFPVGSTDTAGAGGAGTAASFPNRDDTVTYSVVQKRHVGDYENVTPEFPDDEGIHYSELIQFGAGTRPLIQEEVDYATLKH
ncbi:B-cell receptor CD22 isoform X1 [Choloepus didactylus]|uniref:B-cell receptor CD22 isoform X1 n=1 Tax=Choloepus didactylus TaxID=27675 RepID=UPI00189D8A34|nr:B-cell receptor CD22 isoform X1 [Choloepus didactylus]XP_037675098.1 B-cell receptor CD22 isoform X1 [Choloepus didactylus]